MNDTETITSTVEPTVSYHSDEATTDDKLKRRDYAQALARVAQECKPPFVIGIFGTWGVGKTSLMKLIQEELDPALTIPIWFNAWQHQFDDEPVVELAHSLAYSRGKKWTRETKKLTMLVAAAFGERVLKYSTGMKLLDLLKLGQIYDEEKFQAREARQRLHIHLEELVKKTLGNSNLQKRLVFFIDDLDRCMPNQVLRMLEGLKLYLNLKNCVFFVAVDRAVVEQSIKLSYKELPVDHMEYLDKIIQFPFPVPPTEHGSILNFIEHLLPSDLKNSCTLLAEGLGDNPRRVKRFINALMLNHQLALNRSIDDYDPIILTSLLLIQLNEPAVYRRISQEPALVIDLKSEQTDDSFGGKLAPGMPLRKALMKVDFPEPDRLKQYIFLTEIGGVAELAEKESQQSKAGTDDRSMEVIELPPLGAGTDHKLPGRRVLWVDDSGLSGTEGIELQLQKLGVHVTVVRNTETASRSISNRMPDLIISDVSRGADHEAGFTMAEYLRGAGLFSGPIYFYCGSMGLGRLQRAQKVGAQIFTEPRALLKEVTEKLGLM